MPGEYRIRNSGKLSIDYAPSRSAGEIPSQMTLAMNSFSDELPGGVPFELIDDEFDVKRVPADDHVNVFRQDRAGTHYDAALVEVLSKFRGQ